MILTGLGLAISFCLFWWLFVQFFKSPTNTNNVSTAVVTIFPYRTNTPTSDFSSLLTPTITGEGNFPQDIAIGGYVQISGTEGVGLHIRSGPGTDYESKFVGMDSEVFKVEDGPREADGFTWWFLVAPYDTNRSGWAVANYLTVIIQ